MLLWWGVSRRGAEVPRGGFESCPRAALPVGFHIFFFFYSCAKEYDHHQEIVFIRQIQRVSCKEEGILVLVPRELYQDPAELSLCSGGKTNDQK